MLVSLKVFLTSLVVFIVCDLVTRYQERGGGDVSIIVAVIGVLSLLVLMISAIWTIWSL